MHTKASRSRRWRRVGAVALLLMAVVGGLASWLTRPTEDERKLVGDWSFYQVDSESGEVDMDSSDELRLRADGRIVERDASGTSETGVVWRARDGVLKLQYPSGSSELLERFARIVNRVLSGRGPFASDEQYQIEWISADEFHLHGASVVVSYPMQVTLVAVRRGAEDVVAVSNSESSEHEPADDAAGAD